MNKIKRFFRTRYGYDELSAFLSLIAVVLLFLSLINVLRLLYIPAMIILLLIIFRSLSPQNSRRRSEREKYMKLRSSVIGSFKLLINRIRDRKTHRYYRCPGCRAVIRIRKPQKGTLITVTCPKCRRRFDKRA